MGTRAPPNLERAATGLCALHRITQTFQHVSEVPRLRLSSLSHAAPRETPPFKRGDKARRRISGSSCYTRAGGGRFRCEGGVQPLPRAGHDDDGVPGLRGSRLGVLLPGDPRGIRGLRATERDGLAHGPPHPRSPTPSPSARLSKGAPSAEPRRQFASTRPAAGPSSPGPLPPLAAARSPPPPPSRGSHPRRVRGSRP